MEAKKILLLSDTHSYLDPSIEKYMKESDEIWHAGDIGNIQLYDTLCSMHDCVRAVYGNIDGGELRNTLPEYDFISFGDFTVLLIHIAGSFGRYNDRVRDLIKSYHPDVLVCGHSHILKVGFDKRFDILFLNPGACGHHGFHKIRTLLRFVVHEGRIKDVDAIELGKRGRN